MAKKLNRFERSKKMIAYWRKNQERAAWMSRNPQRKCEECGGFLDVQGVCKKCQ